MAGSGRKDPRLTMWTMSEVIQTYLRSDSLSSMEMSHEALLLLTGTRQLR